MTSTGWMIMITSVATVTVACLFCLVRVLSLPPADVVEHLKAPLDIDTGDVNED